MHSDAVPERAAKTSSTTFTICPETPSRFLWPCCPLLPSPTAAFLLLPFRPLYLHPKLRFTSQPYSLFATPRTTKCEQAPITSSSWPPKGCLLFSPTRTAQNDRPWPETLPRIQVQHDHAPQRLAGYKKLHHHILACPRALSWIPLSPVFKTFNNKSLAIMLLEHLYCLLLPSVKTSRGPPRGMARDQTHRQAR